jgi:hypothetical protein
MATESPSSHPNRESEIIEQSSSNFRKLAEQIDAQKESIADQQVEVDSKNPLVGIYQGILIFRKQERDSMFNYDVPLPQVRRSAPNEKWTLDQQALKTAIDVSGWSIEFQALTAKELENMRIERNIEVDDRNPLAGKYKGVCQLSLEYSPGGTTNNTFTIKISNPTMKKTATDANWQLDHDALKKEVGFSLVKWHIDGWNPGSAE